MIQIGLTGGIGAGKTSVAKVLEHMGYPVFYSDLEAKKLYDDHPILKEQMIALFGNELYQNGHFDKNILARQLFQNPILKEKVSELVHPLVREAFEQWASQQHTNMVFNEAAILFETGAYQQFTATILVVAPEDLRIQRVISRDQLTEQEVRNRINQQWTDAQKKVLTPYVIENDGRPLLIQIEACLAAIQN
ncbi:MAG: dephospho-CoA kinase [Sphingomonadales bacterium]|jgi:dephospho-CoA kinase